MSANLAKLEQHLATRSYVEGYTPSQADVLVFKAISAPSGEYPHVTRWYNHIKSYAAEHSALPGSSTAGEAFIGGESAAPAADAEGDDEIDLFGSDDDEDAEAERIKAERVAAYNVKKAGKAKPAAKSIVTMDIKPWDDETDMAELERRVRAIEIDGLVWGGGKLVPIGYGIKKLQINIVIEDEKVSTDELQERIAKDFEEGDEEPGIGDLVQSTDIAAMQKL